VISPAQIDRIGRPEPDPGGRDIKTIFREAVDKTKHPFSAEH
jgi:hypothetical protein